MTSELHTRTFIGAQHLQLAADVGGDPAQPAILLLHGGGQTRHSWGNAQRTWLAQGRHVINLDTRGHGDSQWSETGDYTLDTLAADLRAVIDTLDAPPVLVGASLGGVTALIVAGESTQPQASALVMVDIVPRPEQDGAQRVAAFMRANPQGFASVDEAAAAIAAYYPQRARPADPGGLMKNLRRREDGRLYWHWDPRLIERIDPADATRTSASFTPRLLAACARVTIPVLLVRGLASDIVSDAGVEEFRAHLPQLEVADVSGAGHMVAGDRNDAFVDAVSAFLERHHAGASRQSDGVSA